MRRILIIDYVLIFQKEKNGKIVDFGNTSIVRVKDDENSIPKDVPAHKLGGKWITDVTSVGETHITVDTRGQLYYSSSSTTPLSCVKVSGGGDGGKYFNIFV